MRTLFVATAGLETAPLADGAVLYNLNTGKFVMLNRPAEMLWAELSQPSSEDHLVQELRQTYPQVEPGTARQAVVSTLNELQRLELVHAKTTAGDGERPALATPIQKAERTQRSDYAPPLISVLDEEDLLKVFQMTAAEISVASCWWGACTAGCP